MTGRIAGPIVYGDPFNVPFDARTLPAYTGLRELERFDAIREF